MLSLVLSLIQTVPSDAISLRDLVQYVANAAAVGAFIFAWQTKAELTRIKTALFEDEIGIVPIVGRLRRAMEDRPVATPPDFPGIHPPERSRHKS